MATAELAIVLTANTAGLAPGFATAKQQAVEAGDAIGSKLAGGYDKATAAAESTNAKLRDTTPAMTKVAESAATASSNLGGLSQVTGVLDQALAKIGLGGVSLSGILSALVSPTALLTAGFLATVGAAAVLVSGFLDVASSAKQLSLLGGSTATEAQNVATSFRLAGTDADGLQRALFRVSAEIDGGGQNLAKYGVALRDTAGNAREPMDVLLELRDRIGGMGSAADRNAALVQLFGRAGLELAPAFAKSREEFQALRDLANQKMPWSEEQQQMAKDYNKSMRDLGIAWDGLKVQLGTPIMGVLSITMQGLTGLVSGDWAKGLNEKINSFFGIVATAAEEKSQDVVTSESRAAAAATAAWDQWRKTVVQYGTEAYTSMAASAKSAEASITGEIERALGARSELTNREIKLREGVYSAELQAVQRSVAEKDILLNISLAQHEISETEALQGRLTNIQREKGALTEYWNKRVADANNAKDRDAGIWQQMVSTRAQALGQIEQREQQSVLARIQLEQSYTDAVAKSHTDAATRMIADEDSFTAALKKSRADLENAAAQLFGTEEQAFLTMLGNKRAAEVGAFDESKVTQEQYEQLVKGIDDRLDIEKQAFYRKQEKAELDSITRATQEGRRIGLNALDAIDADHRDAFNKLDALRANELINQEDFENRLRKLNAETQAAKLTAVGETDTAWITKTQETLGNIDRLLDQYQGDDDVRERLITTKHRLESENRVRLFQDETFKRNEQNIKETNDLAKAITDQNTQAHRLQTANEELRAAMQQRDGEYFGFLGTQLELAVGKWGDTWDQIKGATTTVVDSVQSTLGDGLFTFIKTGTFDAKKFFGDMTDAFLKSATDLLAKKGIQALVGLGKDFIDGFTGADGGIGGMLQNVGSKITGFFAQGQPFDKLLDFGADVVHGFTGAAAGIQGELASVEGKLASFFGAGGHADDLLDFGANIVTGFKTVPTGLAGTLGDVEGKLSNFFGSTGHADDLLDFGKDVVDGFKGMGAGLDTALTGASGAASIIDKFMQIPVVKSVFNIGNGILDGLKSAWTGLTQFFTDFASGIGSFTNVSWVKSVFNFGSSILDSLKGAWGGLTDWFTQFAGGLGDFFNVPWVHSVLDFGGSILDGLVSVGPKIGDFFMHTVVPMVQAFLDSAAVKGILEWGTDFLSGIFDFLHFNTGGLVPGSGGPDTVPALLTPGELVLSTGQTNMFLTLIDKIAGTHYADFPTVSTGFIGDILGKIIGGDASLNWSMGGLRGLLFGVPEVFGSPTAGLLGFGGVGQGIIGSGVQGLFEVAPVIGAMMSGLMSGGNPTSGLIGSIIGSYLLSGGVEAAVAAAGGLALGPLALAAAPLVAGFTSAISELFTSHHYENVRKQAAATWAQEFPEYLLHLEQQRTPAGLLEGLALLQQRPGWAIQPPPDWQTNPHAAASFISVGYLSQDFTHGAGRELTNILHRQWELIVNAQGGSASAIAELDNRVHGAEVGQRSYRIMGAERSWQGDPLGTIQRLIDLHIDPAKLPIPWGSIDWSAMGFTGYDNALSAMLQAGGYPPDWTLFHQGGLVPSGIDMMPFADKFGVPALLEPGELVVPRPYTEEVLRRAANDNAEESGDVHIDHLEVNITVAGGDDTRYDRRFWREQAREIRVALEDELKLRRQ